MGICAILAGVVLISSHAANQVATVQAASAVKPPTASTNAAQAQDKSKARPTSSISAVTR